MTKRISDRNFPIAITAVMVFLSFSFYASPKGTESLFTKSKATFIENNGQWPTDILYQGMSLSTNAYLLKDGISFSQKGKAENKNDSPVLVWNMKFKDINSAMEINGVDGKESVYNYLSGSNADKWVIHPKEYMAVNYSQIYEKIDLQFYGNGNQLEYDYILHKGSNIQSIQTSFEGIKNLKINSDGELVVATEWNKQIQKAPVAWQIIGGIKNEVKVEYVLINDSTFGFHAKSDYNINYDLIIDPLFEMVWSSYTRATGAGNNINYCFSNAMDKEGNVYLTGMVDGTFPTTPGAYSGPGNVYPEIFVAKFSSDGSTLLYSTYLPGNSSEHGVAIAVDDSGRAYVTGIIDLNITGVTNYASTANAYQPVHGGGSDAFLTVLNPTGTALVYSSFLGGTGGEAGYGIALGSMGTAYITGYTSIQNFPVKAAPAFPSGDKDVFVAKFDINQSGNNSLIYSTHFGAGPFFYCTGYGIAVNSTGNAFVTGTVGGSFGSPVFPTTAGAYNTTYNTGQDGYMTFATKLSATTPLTLDYSTYLAPGTGNAIAVDPSDNAYVAGTTYTFAFPVTTGALQTVHAGAGGTDAFAIKLNAAGSALIYSTFLGGNLYDKGTGIAVNSAEEAYVTGIAQDGFPTSTGAYQPANAGTQDFFVVNLNSTGTGYACGGSTFVGGSEDDYSGSFYDYPSPHISLRDHGGINDSVCVSSTSHSQDFPTTPGAYEPLKVNSIADQPVFFKMTCAIILLPPVPLFSSQVNTTCSSATVNFTDSTLNNPTSWQWSFPGAIPDTSSLQNPQGIQFPASGSYTVKLVSCNSVSCDSITATIQITITGTQTVSLGNDTVVCIGNNVTLTAPSGFTNNTWHFNGNTIGANLSSVVATQQGAYSITVSDTAGCSASDTIFVRISDPSVSLGSDIVLCNNDSVQVIATPGFSSYNWQNNGNSFTTNLNSIYANNTGNYIVNVTDSVGCSAADTISSIASSAAVVLIDDSSFCAGGSITIDAGQGFTSYEWRLNNAVISNSNSISANQSGNYSVLVTNQDNCTAKDSVTITVHPLPDIRTIADASICTGQRLKLTTMGAVTFQWSPSLYLSSDTSSSPVSSPLSTVHYVVTGTDGNGCTGSDNLTIEVNTMPDASFEYSLQSNCEGVELSTLNKSLNATDFQWNFGDGFMTSEINPLHHYSVLNNQSIQLVALNGGCSDTFRVENISSEIAAEGFFFVPNTFTPNGDDLNNEFTIMSSNDCDYFHLEIFNRWGELIHQTEGHEVKWNGKYKSENAPEGVYVYVLKSKTVEKVGHVTLLR